MILIEQLIDMLLAVNKNNVRQSIRQHEAGQSTARPSGRRMAARSQVVELPLVILIEQLIDMLLAVNKNNVRQSIRQHEAGQRFLTASRPY
ncbi:MAG: hypothetical protein JOZ45_06245 [Acidobacteriaceae bacterium]|nr:hypothetical protein [Acidobacteriaceae bacterium]